MQENSNLAARLKKQMQLENETIQNLTQQQLDTMRKELSSTFRQELNTIVDDIQEQNSSLAWKMFRSRFLWPTLIGLSLCLGLFGGSWGAMRYYSNRIAELQQNVQVLEEKGGKIQFSKCGETGKKRLCIKMDLDADSYGTDGVYPWMIPEGY